MPAREAPCVELGSAPRTPSVVPSPSPSISSTSSPEPQNVRATPLFRALAMPPPEPVQPPGQEELERRLPGYRRIVIPRDLTLIELLKQSSGAVTDEEVLRIREVKLRVVAERVGLRRLHVLAPRLRSLTLDGSALSSLRDLGIDLVHLKVLSVNRCGLTSLDGIWGLGALRELHAAGNRLQELHPLAALQKLHTLNIADNPIEDSTRLWMLGVCTTLRHLTLRGTPAADLPDYRSSVASALPMLMYLDGRPLHEELDDDLEEELAALSSSESETELPPDKPVMPSTSQREPSTSNEIYEDQYPEDDSECLEMPVANTKRKLQRRRPATTEGAGLRPLRPNIPPRPRTAVERPTIDAPTRLQILNTLMDEEWRCSGSKLTSHGAVCGNLARALRRPSTAHHRTPDIESEEEKELLAERVADATRALAAEIPRAPRLEDWVKFKEATGIDIEIDFNARREGDASSAIERLEQIEKETSERLKNEEGNSNRVAHEPPRFGCSMTILSDYEMWRREIFDESQIQNDVDSLFSNIGLVHSNDGTLPD